MSHKLRSRYLKWTQSAFLHLMWRSSPFLLFVFLKLSSDIKTNIPVTARSRSFLMNSTNPNLMTYVVLSHPQVNCFAVVASGNIAWKNSPISFLLMNDALSLCAISRAISFDAAIDLNTPRMLLDRASVKLCWSPVGQGTDDDTD